MPTARSSGHSEEPKLLTSRGVEPLLFAGMGHRSAVRHPSRDRLRGAALATMGLAALLSGCGIGSKAAQPASSSAASSVGSVSTAGSGDATSDSPSTAAAGGDDCGGAVSRVTAAVTKYPEITRVDTVAACGEVSIETKLPDGALGSDSANKGVDICVAAAKVAYKGDVSSVTVNAADGHELAIGLKSSDCIPG